MKKTLGMRIRELREEKDLSLREFAKNLGLSAAFISDVELSRRHPSDNVLAQMARILETSLDELTTFDTRVPLEELKRLVNENPEYGRAFRRVINKKVTPEELNQLADKKSGNTRSKPEE